MSYRATMLAVGLVALLLGLAIGWAVKPAKAPADLLLRERLRVINAHLAEAAPGYVFLAGDSHMELANPGIGLCGREVVDGGISGARAGFYADALQRMRFPTRAFAAVLTIGTNDLWRKHEPGRPGALRRYEQEARRIVGELKRSAETVFVTAVPPIGQEQAGNADVKAGNAYSDSLRDLCAAEGCRFIDPFAYARSEAPGIARPGILRDGVHFGSYRPVLAAMAPLVCGSEPSR